MPSWPARETKAIQQLHTGLDIHSSQAMKVENFATLEEEAAEELVPRLEIILKHLMAAFGKYQRRNPS
ncbi:hypothetical protein KIW84_015614 [Lathyrus oleraceus]|uniref:Uncharacterized protein n=1 Tax=Pisum sativum TaxID=3888 RepID=A0A9D4X035_PEA|nr:hypothetical protein KIW84_056185 [Pisum sativum]KAI5410943.1 hypothetical protein KIW84_056186 [Pisum sativum]KAI5448254.1 hypothetical protein KIW84_015614 [Pisum sativum]